MADGMDAATGQALLWEAELVEPETDGPQTPVEVAVDAPGATKTYDYTVPSRLVPVEPGEAVLVEFGKRQALGIVLGSSTDVVDLKLKPLQARVHAGGPLLPPLMLDFARWISAEYLASPAAVLRSMVPPGMLERLELMAEWLPSAAPDRALDTAEGAIHERLAGGPLPVRDLEVGEGRAALLRNLRAMADFTGKAIAGWGIVIGGAMHYRKISAGDEVSFVTIAW